MVSKSSLRPLCRAPSRRDEPPVGTRFTPGHRLYVPPHDTPCPTLPAE